MSFLSVDVGSSHCKAALFSATGEMIALRTARYFPEHPKPGFAEIDPSVFLKVIATLSRDLSGLQSEEPIESLCLSSHGETLIPVGAEGRPLCGAILNTDSRALKEAAWFEENVGRDRIFSITGHVSHAMYPASKLLWLRNYLRDVFSTANQFLGVTDFILLRLGLDPLVDYSHAARFMVLDVHSHAWSSEILSILGLTSSRLATPVQAGTIAGRLGDDAASLLGLRTGTPVVVGGHDQVIGAVGLGIINNRRSAASLGTYECVLAVSDTPQLNDAALKSCLNSFPHAVSTKFVTIAYFPSGIMLQWLRDLLEPQQSVNRNTSDDIWDALEVAAPPGPSGLLVTPHLIGTCNPEFDASAKATIHGLTLSTGRSHIHKGIIEGIAAELGLICESMDAAISTSNDINVSGGGTRSHFGLRLRAALTGKRLHIMNCHESVCLGGAILASVATGVHADLESAVEAMVHERECVAVDHSLADQYRTHVARYRRFRASALTY